jgi:membrane protein implicated in regulation of membrane protease activity
VDVRDGSFAAAFAGVALACHIRRVDIWLVVWLVIGVALVVAELFTTTFVLLMLAAGAFAAAGASALGVGVAGQGAVFAVVSALALFGVRPALRRHVQGGEHDTPMGVEAIEGSTGLVIEDIDEDHGMVKIEGELWRARPYDVTQQIPVGERVRVIEIKGATAMVWRD